MMSPWKTVGLLTLLCSNIYEVNQWLWQLGCGKPRMDGLSVEVTEERKQADRDEQHKRAVETRQRSKADQT